MNEINFTTQSSFLHHGIQGQKWGVQNGPPYPLDRATAKEIKKQAKRDLNNTEAVKKMNKGSMIGAAVGQFVAGPVGAGAGASLGSYIAFNKLSPEVKNEYYDKVKKYSDAKDQYKVVKKYEKVSLKEAKKASRADFDGDKVKNNTNSPSKKETDAWYEIDQKNRKGTVTSSDIKKLYNSLDDKSAYKDFEDFKDFVEDYLSEAVYD